ncbi:MAG: phage tail tube protein [Pseudomonadota bacterium]|nr:phage tail tube protein [Pseudomonadota bacterium]
MANIPSGSDSFLILGKETTWGTIAGAGTGRKLAISGEDLDGPEELIKSDSFSGDANSRDSVLGDVDAGGSFSHNVTLESAPLLANALNGLVATTGAGDPYTHTSKVVAGNVASYSAEVYLANDTPQYKQLVGCRVNTLGFEIAHKGFFKWQIGLLGKSAALATASFATSPDDWTAVTELHHRMLAAADVKLDTAAFAQLRSLKCDASNQLDGDVRVVGGAGVRGQISRGVQTLSGTCEVYFDAPASVFNKTVSGTYVAFDFMWRTGVANRTMNLVLPRVKLGRAFPKASGGKALVLSVPWEASYDPTEASQIKIVVVNGIVGTKYSA